MILQGSRGAQLFRPIRGLTRGATSVDGSGDLSRDKFHSAASLISSFVGAQLVPERVPGSTVVTAAEEVVERRLHEISRVQRRQALGLTGLETQPFQVTAAALVHVSYQLHELYMAGANGCGFPRPGRQQQQRVEHLFDQTRRVAQYVVAALNGLGQSRQ